MNRDEKAKDSIYIASGHSSITGVCFNHIPHINRCQEMSEPTLKAKPPSAFSVSFCQSTSLKAEGRNAE